MPTDESLSAMKSELRAVYSDWFVWLVLILGLVLWIWTRSFIVGAAYVAVLSWTYIGLGWHR